MTDAPPVALADEHSDPAAEAERKRLQALYAAVGATVLLFFASFHPLDLGLLAWIALVPMLHVGLTASRREAVATSYGATFLYHLVGLSWIALVTAPGWVSTTFLEGFYTVAVVLLARWMRRTARLPLSLTLPPLWVAGEFSRGAHLGFIKFPWLLIGQTQHARSNLIQIADVTSVYGLSFLVVLVNAALVDALLLAEDRAGVTGAGPALRALAGAFVPDRVSTALGLATPKERDAVRRGVGRLAVAPVAALLVANVYGLVRARQVEANLLDGPRVLAVQPDFPMNVDGTSSVRPEVQARRQFDLTRVGLLDVRKNEDLPDAIVWSETSWVWPINYKAPDRREWDALWGDHFDVLATKYPGRFKSGAEIRAFEKELFDLARQYRCDVLVGAPDYGRFETLGTPDNAKHNSFYQIAGDGSGNVVVKARYDKINLVPASEGIPFSNPDSRLHWFYRFLKGFVPEGFDTFEEGRGPVVMTLAREPRWKLSPDICFEVSFPELLRLGTLAGADVMVCPSNDGWFHTSDQNASAEIPLAFDHAQLRAIENRRGMLRVVNRGVTCIIDPLGRMTAQVEGNERRLDGTLQRSNVHVEGTLFARVPTTRLTSLYVTYGDFFAWLATLASLALAGFSWWTTRGARGASS